MNTRRSIGVFVLALTITGWNCGNVGPVVSSLTREFDITLGEVGLLSGTFFFAGSACGSLAGAVLARRVRIMYGIWACCLLSVAGNLLFAAGDAFAVLAAGTAEKLFPFEDPIGRSIHVERDYYVVVGVMRPRAPSAGIGGSLAAQDFSSDVYVPISTLWGRIGDRVVTRRSGSFEIEEVELSQITLRVDRVDNVLQTAELVKATLAQYHRDKDYGVTVPDLPGCFSAGATVDEALAMTKEAIELHLEGLIEEGMAVPEPGRIEDYKRKRDYAGGTWALVSVDPSSLRLKAQRVTITVPERVLDAIDRYARDHNETRSALLARAALDYIGRAGDKAMPEARPGRPRKARVTKGR